MEQLHAETVAIRSFMLIHTTSTILLKTGMALLLTIMQAVLPIPWKRKFGIDTVIIYHLFSNSGIFQQPTLEVQDDLLKNLFRFVRYGDYIFNHGNSWIKNMASHNNYIPKLITRLWPDICII